MGLRGWMTRDFDAVTNIIKSHLPEVDGVEEKLGSIVTRLQKAEDLADGDRKALEQRR